MMVGCERPGCSAWWRWIGAEGWMWPGSGGISGLGFGRRRVQQDLAQKGVERELIASTLETAYEDVDEVALARQYIARKRMKQPSGENKQKETVRAMNRLMRAGFSSRAIFKVLREWDVEVEEVDLEDAPEESAG